jgi:glycosyltransferase involved in cell wall biosynthesis
MTAETPKIPKVLLFLLNDAPFFVTHRLSLAEAAIARGSLVHVAAPPDAEAALRIESTGATFHPIPLRRGGTNLFGEARLISVFHQLIRSLRPDLVHAITMKPVIYGGTAARIAIAPAAVFSVTGLGHLFLTESWKARLLRSLVRKLFGLALHHPNSRTIFQNQDDLEMFVSEGSVPEATSVIVPGTGIDLDLFCPRKEERSGPLVVMFPARLIGEKGLREFAEAAGELKRAGSTARFVMVGRSDPENPSDIGADQITAWEQEGWIENWGFHDTMPDTLRKADVVCLPSYREGAPRCLIEALATGLPIVTTDSIGCRDMIDDSKNGLLVPVKDGPATARAIARILDDSDLRVAMGHHSRQMAEQTFAVGQFVTATFAVYGEVLKPAGSKSVSSTP